MRASNAATSLSKSVIIDVPPPSLKDAKVITGASSAQVPSDELTQPQRKIKRVAEMECFQPIREFPDPPNNLVKREELRLFRAGGVRIRNANSVREKKTATYPCMEGVILPVTLLKTLRKDSGCEPNCYDLTLDAKSQSLY